MKIFYRFFYGLLFVIFLFPLSGLCSAKTDNDIETAFKTYDGDFLIYINKNNFSLTVYNRNLQIMAKYIVGYGLNPDKKAKLYSGDNRTPEGIYYITEILSLDAEKNTESYIKLKQMNNTYFKASEGHYKFGRKNVDLGKEAFGLRFFRFNYPNQNDKNRYYESLKQKMIPSVKGRISSIGSGLAIHGNNDKNSIGQLCSSGCVRMYNEDIVELDKYICLNMPVLIVNE